MKRFVIVLVALVLVASFAGFASAWGPPKIDTAKITIKANFSGQAVNLTNLGFGKVISGNATAGGFEVDTCFNGPNFGGHVGAGVLDVGVNIAAAKGAFTDITQQVTVVSDLDAVAKGKLIEKCGPDMSLASFKYKLENGVEAVQIVEQGVGQTLAINGGLSLAQGNFGFGAPGVGVNGNVRELALVANVALIDGVCTTVEQQAYAGNSVKITANGVSM